MVRVSALYSIQSFDTKGLVVRRISSPLKSYSTNFQISSSGKGGKELAGTTVNMAIKQEL